MGIDGKSSYVLPCDMINRIIYNSGGYTDTYNKSLDDVWHINGIDNRYVTSIVCVLQSFKQLFIASDVYVFLSENNNWSEIINSHLGPFGLGSRNTLIRQMGLMNSLLNLMPMPY